MFPRMTLTDFLEQLQKVLDEYMGKVEDMGKKKEEEILAI